MYYYDWSRYKIVYCEIFRRSWSNWTDKENLPEQLDLETILTALNNISTIFLEPLSLSSCNLTLWVVLGTTRKGIKKSATNLLDRSSAATKQELWKSWERSGIWWNFSRSKSRWGEISVMSGFVSKSPTSSVLVFEIGLSKFKTLTRWKNARNKSLITDCWTRKGQWRHRCFLLGSGSFGCLDFGTVGCGAVSPRHEV